MPVARTRLLATLGIVLLLTPALAGCATPTAVEPSKAKDLVVDQVPDGARLNWDEFPRGVAVGYVVYRDGQKIAETGATNRTFTDRNVEPERTYKYAVAAKQPSGKTTARTEEHAFRYERSMALLQDERVKRGFVNLTVVQVTPGIKWSALEVRLDGASLRLDEDAYRQRGEAWSHSAPRDDLADLDEKLQVHAPGKARPNSTLEVRLDGGKLLFSGLLQGNPTINVTLKQERNATGGLVSLLVLDTAWRDGGRDVSASYADLVPRWSAMEVRINGTLLPYQADGREGSWSHETPTNDVLAEGKRFILRSTALVTAGANVVVHDAEAGEESFRLVLR